MSLFDPQKFKSLLGTRSFGRVFHYHEILDSSNRLLKDLAAQGAPEGTVVLADEQSAGRGRWGRSWQSPKGAGLLVSLLLRPGNHGPQKVSQLTAVFGVAVLRVVNRLPLSAPAKLKWPNDLWVEGRKLSGLLLESAGDGIVAGLGLNCDQKAADLPPDIQATSLALLCGRAPDREALLAAILLEAEVLYEIWKSGDFDPIRLEWDRNACFVGEQVAAGGVEGRVLGLDSDGALLLEGPQGQVTLHSGEVKALRPI